MAVMRQAMEEAKLAPADIDAISASANSTKAGDEMEHTAITRIFNGRASHIPTNAVKGLVGETFSASGALQVASVLGTLAESSHTVLVDGFGPTGVASALVIGSKRED